MKVNDWCKGYNDIHCLLENAQLTTLNLINRMVSSTSIPACYLLNLVQKTSVMLKQVWRGIIEALCLHWNIITSLIKKLQVKIFADLVVMNVYMQQHLVVLGSFCQQTWLLITVAIWQSGKLFLGEQIIFGAVSLNRLFFKVAVEYKYRPKEK